MQTLEKELDPAQLQQKVKRIILKGPCILQGQGMELFASTISDKAMGYVVAWDFQAVQHYSPAFFDGLFQQGVVEDFKNINADYISPLGRKLLYWALEAHYDDVPNTKPLYQVYKAATGKLYPVLYQTNGIITLMTESGIAEWLEHNGTIQEIEPVQYERIMSEYTNAHIEYRERQLAASKPLECPKCHQAYHGSINGYRKHVRNCKKGDDN